MTDFYKELGKRIEYYRKASGLSLEELGKRVGVGKSTIRKYEQAMIKVSHERLEAISNALGIDVSLLYGEELQDDVKERFEMKEFKTVNVKLDEIVETEIIESINVNDDNVVGRDEDDQEVVIRKVTLDDGIVYEVTYETNGVVDREEYFETLEEAKEYAERIN